MVNDGKKKSRRKFREIREIHSEGQLGEMERIPITDYN
jgi:hypothetical protein